MKIGNILLKKGSYLNEEPFILCQSTARNPGPFAKQQQLHIDSNLPIFLIAFICKLCGF